MEGGHPKIGAELAKRYGETSKEVLHAIAGHHDDVTIDHIYTVLVAAADAISAARPGARRETLEKYVKRLEELEAVASGFPGVEHAYAIQAGREVRVIANASQTSRQRSRQGVPRHRPGDRGAAALSRRDQGDRRARDAGGRIRPIAEQTRRPGAGRQGENADGLDGQSARHPRRRSCLRSVYALLYRPSAGETHACPVHRRHRWLRPA